MAVVPSLRIRVIPIARLAGAFAARRRSGRRAWTPALGLALILLFSQWLGMLHSIAHAGWPEHTHTSFNAALFNYADGADNDDNADGSIGDKQHPSHGKSHHSCVEYDAAAGAAGIHAAFFSPPLIPGAQVLALWQAFASWDAPAVCHFSSRAPPR